MDIRVFFSSISRQRALRRFIQIRMKSALKRHNRVIQHGTVRIRDINSDRGGVDKECTVVLETKDAGTLILTESHRDAGQAFKNALRKLKSNLRQKLERTAQRSGQKRRYARSFKYAV